MRNKLLLIKLMVIFQLTLLLAVIGETVIPVLFADAASSSSAHDPDRSVQVCSMLSCKRKI